MKNVDEFYPAAQTFKDKDGKVLKLFQGYGGIWHVTIPYDSGYAFTTISGTLAECKNVMRWLKKMHVGD